MAEDSFVLISLKDEKAKKLGELLGNPTAKKILELLAKKEYTATDLAKEMNIPLSTIHYNLTNLEQGKLVIADEYHYSAKGKEVKHYKLANKMVIITPEQPSESIIEKLKKILPVALIAAGITTALQWYWNLSSAGSKSAGLLLAAPMAEQAVEKAVYDYSATTAFEASESVAQSSANLVWLFLAVAMTTILAYFLVTFLLMRRKR
jgi:DNA-binding transcriptional ArsR family regulator